MDALAVRRSLQGLTGPASGSELMRPQTCAVSMAGVLPGFAHARHCSTAGMAAHGIDAAVKLAGNAGHAVPCREVLTDQALQPEAGIMFSDAWYVLIRLTIGSWFAAEHVTDVHLSSPGPAESLRLAEKPITFSLRRRSLSVCRILSPMDWRLPDRVRRELAGRGR